ncbi:MAG: twin-arginine translocation signal domain-containing protein, partial [Planctomycetes bacterium]|nr:twin-arginine translocation signal domain-containing protein [Planctomycetota bacterium]
MSEPIEKPTILNRPISRRDFLKTAGVGAGAMALASFPLSLTRLMAADGIDNPLEHYPDRDWEEIYRDQY